MPIEWLIEAAHQAETSVYAMIQPYHHTEERELRIREWATPEMMRAAAANYWALGADGMYSWFLRWPLGDASRRILTELGDPDLVREADKHYLLNRSLKIAQRVGYPTVLPLEITASDRSTHKIIFTIADDIGEVAERIRQIQLRINIRDLVSVDRLRILLNGQSLVEETCLRDYGSPIAPYLGQWLKFELKKVRPRKGHNRLELILDKRADGLVSPLKVEDVEIIVEYGSYPSVINRF